MGAVATTADVFTLHGDEGSADGHSTGSPVLIATLDSVAPFMAAEVAWVVLLLV